MSPHFVFGRQRVYVHGVRADGHVRDASVGGGVVHVHSVARGTFGHKGVMLDLGLITDEHGVTKGLGAIGDGLDHLVCHWVVYLQATGRPDVEVSIQIAILIVSWFGHPCHRYNQQQNRLSQQR